MIDIKVRNIVCGGSVGTRVSLDQMASLPGATYHPSEFPGVRFRLNDCTVIIFSSGKVVVAGALTTQAADRAVNMLADKLQNIGIRTGEIQCRVCNIVATASLGSTLNLCRISKIIPRSLYEPEHFSGVILRWAQPKCTVLLFATGNLVCVGANSVQGASNAVNQLYSELSRGHLWQEL